MIENVQRTAYGKALVEIGAADKRLVVLEADLGKSTMTCLFGDAYPERYFQMGIAEQNMMSTAAGLALTGKVAFVNSFAVFAAARTYDQFRQTISIARLNVKVCGSSSGLSDYGDGSTHQAIEDMAIMRAIPNVTVLCPVDAIETPRWCGRWLRPDGPMYMRVNRNPCRFITKEDDPFEITKMRVLREGADAVIFATASWCPWPLRRRKKPCKGRHKRAGGQRQHHQPLDRDQVIGLAAV
jgi:transketolase